DADLDRRPRHQVGERLREDVGPLLIEERRHLAGRARRLVDASRLLAALDLTADGALSGAHRHGVHRGAVGERESVDGLHRLREPKAFLGYVRIITRNKFIDRLKARLRHHEKEALPWDEETARAVAAPAALDGRARELWSAVRDLPPEEQRVLDGVYRQGKTY